MNNWKPATELPDSSVEQIWWHCGDGVTYTSERANLFDSWDVWFRQNKTLIGWIPIVPPPAPQPPTQKELDDAAAVSLWRERGTAFASTEIGDIPALWLEGWCAGVERGRKE